MKEDPRLPRVHASVTECALPQLEALAFLDGFSNSDCGVPFWADFLSANVGRADLLAWGG